MGYKGGSSGKECQHVLRHIELVEHPRDSKRNNVDSKSGSTYKTISMYLSQQYSSLLIPF